MIKSEIEIGERAGATPKFWEELKRVRAKGDRPKTTPGTQASCFEFQEHSLIRMEFKAKLRGHVTRSGLATMWRPEDQKTLVAQCHTGRPQRSQPETSRAHEEHIFKKWEGQSKFILG
jgi:hypothetical protein